MYFHAMKYVFLVLLGFISYQNMAQKVTISPELVLRDDYGYSLLGQIGEQVIVHRNRGYRQELELYSSNLDYLQSVPLELEETRVKVLGFLTTSFDFTCYYSFKSSGKEYVKAAKLSSFGELLHRDTIDVTKKLFSSKDFRLYASENDRYVAIFNTEQDKLDVLIYDNQEMKKLSKVSLDISDFNIHRDFRKVKITNQGTAIFLFEKHNTLFKREQHYYRTFSIDPQGTVTDKKIHVPNIITQDVDMVVTSDHNYRIFGLYSEKIEDKSTGYFCYQDSLKIVPFSQEMMASITLKNKRNEKGLAEFEIADMNLRQDGGLVVSLETTRSYIRGSNLNALRPSSFRTENITEYYHEDILVMSLSSDHDMDWYSILPKKQFSQDDKGKYSSFFILKTPSKFRYLFNDHIRVNSTVSEYILNPKGTFDRNAVMNTLDQNIKLRIRNSIQSSNNTVLSISEKSNRIYIVKFEY